MGDRGPGLAANFSKYEMIKPAPVVGAYTKNTVSTFDTNVNTSLLFPLNGEPNFRASVTLIYSATIMFDLLISPTCISEFECPVDIRVN
jgi:hypothetical protein